MRLPLTAAAWRPKGDDGGPGHRCGLLPDPPVVLNALVVGSTALYTTSAGFLGVTVTNLARDSEAQGR